jgi:hypothetical protein
MSRTWTTDYPAHAVGSLKFLAGNNEIPRQDIHSWLKFRAAPGLVWRLPLFFV